MLFWRLGRIFVNLHVPVVFVHKEIYRRENTEKNGNSCQI